MFAHLFRRGPDLSQASVRAASEADLPRIAHLMRDAERRYYGLSSSELPQLLAAVPAVVLETPTELLGVAISGWRARRVTWLRCVTLARGVDIAYGLNAMLPELHQFLRHRQMQHIFYAGNDTSDIWLMPALKQYGYVHDTTVIVYEKHTLHIPSCGNQDILVRPARTADLPALVELDNLCFEAHWTKHEAALSSAVSENSFFVVAQAETQIVGYAYATSHFHGRLVHLVRLGVDPRQQHLGVGARLMAELILFARSLNADVVTLNTQSYNERAQRIYRWFGFAPNGESQAVLRYDL